MVADVEVVRDRESRIRRYGEIDLQRVYKILQDNLQDFDRYLVAIERYLNRRG
jgi:uncharacterized protein YutE (UPF0331/DUF86 family)